MMRKLFSLLMVATVLCGCNSKKSEESDSKSGDQSAQAESLDRRFVRLETHAENESRARELVDSLKQRLQSDLDSLKTQVGRAENNQEKMRLYAELNPVPGFVADIVKTVEAFPEFDSTFDGAIAGLAHANDQQRDLLMNYLLDQWPQRLNHRKIVEYLLELVPGQQVEVWFRKVIAAAPEGVDKAEAMMGFKTYFDHQPVFAKTLEMNPKIAQKFSAQQLEYIRSERTDSQNAEIEGYLQTVIDKYGDVKFTGSGMNNSDTFGEAASCELFELKHLNVGDIAPDIVGKDLDGETFRLSDYRGKVVMLDFWGQWCPPCRRMYPYERHIVKELSGLPFALIGVNSDTDLQTAKDSVRDEPLPWRNFWNGPDGTSGPIAKQWNISEWPTVYLIDGDGVIRYKAALGKDIEAGVEALMAEQGHHINLDQIDLAAN